MDSKDNIRRTDAAMRADTVENLLKSLSEIFKQTNGNETAIGYIEEIKKFFQEKRMPNDTEVEFSIGILTLVQHLLKKE